MTYQIEEFASYSLSVAMTESIDDLFGEHFAKVNQYQEDLSFFYWRPSRGATRYTAVVNQVVWPAEGDRVLQGNVAFTLQYVNRVIDLCPEGSGIGLAHCHFTPGWQDMSDDDVVAERDRLAGLVAGKTNLPLVGLTWGIDRFWSGRFWLRAGRKLYERVDAKTTRSAGQRLRMSFLPSAFPSLPQIDTQLATVSVWGKSAHDDLVRTKVGIVGLGSVGSIVAECLSRTGIQHITLIDHDYIEKRNLDRTLGSLPDDPVRNLSKVAISDRLLHTSHTSDQFATTPIDRSLLTKEGLEAALDCDVLISCVDRPYPRSILNTIAYAHLIPVIDGGIIARVNDQGKLLHVDWRIHTVGPQHGCLYCIGALLRSDVALDRDGMLDDPDYVKGLSPADRERYGRRNVFAFSLSVAAHEVLQLIGLVTGQERVGGAGNQTYHAYPGVMEMAQAERCDENCDVAQLTASACTVLDEDRR